MVGGLQVEVPGFYPRRELLGTGPHQQQLQKNLSNGRAAWWGPCDPEGGSRREEEPAGSAGVRAGSLGFVCREDE